jgi:hypothetical protein
MILELFAEAAFVRRAITLPVCKQVRRARAADYLGSWSALVWGCSLFAATPPDAETFHKAVICARVLIASPGGARRMVSRRLSGAADKDQFTEEV